MKRLKRQWAIICFLLVVILGGCSTPSPITAGTVDLRVTKDFGKEDLFRKSIELRARSSVMELLNNHLEVKTEYGGGFVNAINGLESGYTNKKNKEKADWFYFMNGIMTNVGATEYYPINGDVIWWDYHWWGDIPFTPAVIGSFPQPFINGYQGQNPGTLILAGNNCEDLAQSLKDALEKAGVEDVVVEGYEEKLAADRSRMTIVVALWEELSESKFWTGIQENRDKTGWFAELDKDVFYPLNKKAQRQGAYKEGVGAILSTGMGMGDSTPLWLLTGVDIKGLAEAADLLIHHDHRISNKFGVLVADGEIIDLPKQE